MIDPENGVARTILLVEDEAIIAMHEKSILERLGYRVTTVHTGERAVETMAETPEIDLVLMDINLGSGMDGTQAAELILRDHDLPVVFLSSHTEPEVVGKTEKISSYGYIVKNSGPTVLSTSIKMAFRLFESRKLARDTFDHATDGLCVHRFHFDDAGRPRDCEYLKVNRAFELHTGLAASSVVGRTMRDVYPNGEVADLIVLYAEVLAGRRSQQQELFFEPMQAWFQLIIYPTRDDDFTVVIRNITERKQTQERIAAEKEWLRVTLQSVGDAVIATDTGGNVVLLNGVAETLTGWTNDAAWGRPLAEVFDIVNAMTRKTCPNPVERALREGTIVGLANHTVLRSADGCEYQIADSAAPIMDAEGGIIGVVLVFRDVTEAYELAHALEESERDMRRAQAMSRLGSWRFDLNSGKVVASDETFRIYGVVDAEPTIAMVQTVPLPSYRRELDEALRALVEEGAPYDVEFEIRRPSDNVVRRIHSIAEYDAERNVVTGTIQDITERVHDHERIRGLLAEKELLLKESHHRVVNNMNTIHSLLTLQVETAGSSACRDILAGAADRMQRMMGVYDRLYRQTTFHEMSLQEFLPPLVEEIVAVYQRAVPVRATVQVDDIVLDTRTLSTLGVIVNELITNSMKHAFVDADEGHIFVTASETATHLVISCADDGRGLSCEPSPGKPPGFGMELVRALVGQMNGDIRIDGDAGTRATIEVMRRIPKQ